MRMCHFQTQNTPIYTEQNFLIQTIIITFIYLLVIFTAQNLKQILTVDPELWGCPIFEPKTADFSKMRIFFRKPVKDPCFFHSYPSTYEESQSDIYLLGKYWQLKNTKISLTKNNFWL